MHSILLTPGRGTRFLKKKKPRKRSCSNEKSANTRPQLEKKTRSFDIVLKKNKGKRETALKRRNPMTTGRKETELMENKTKKTSRCTSKNKPVEKKTFKRAQQENGAPLLGRALSSLKACLTRDKERATNGKIVRDSKKEQRTSGGAIAPGKAL